jgi:hypothetical protein
MSWKNVKRQALLAVFGLVAAGGCSGSTGSTEDPGKHGDRPTNGVIQIDESEIVGVVNADALTIDIPVKSLKRAAKGKLNVSLREVDGSQIHESAQSAYDVSAGGTDHVVATFTRPLGIGKQADWVRQNLRVDDGTTHGLRVTTSLMRVVSPYEIRLQGPQQLTEEKPATYRVHAQNPFTRKPLPNLEVELSLDQNGASTKKLSSKTDLLGDAVFPVTLAEAGKYAVVASTSAQGTSAALDAAVDVAEPGRKLLLTSDKPIYQPGQIIHLRTLALSPPEDTPVAGESATFEVEDGKGNKIMKRELITDAYGIAATDFELGRILNEGTFKLRAVLGSTTTEKSVEVSHYALPKFKLSVGIDKTWYGPGDTLHGSIDAGYFFGKPVNGADVVIEGITFDVGETVFQKVVGKTNTAGKMEFALTLPSSLVGLPLEQGNALLAVRATVTDTAGQMVKKDTAVTVAEAPLRVVVVPEATELVPGIPNWLDIFVSDPLGAPIEDVAVKATLGDQSLEQTTDEFGHAAVSVTPASTGDGTVQVVATPIAGEPVTASFTFGAQTGAEHVLVRTDKSVYAIGETVEVEIRATAGEAHAYVDWLNRGQAVDMRTLDLDPNGVGTFAMSLDTELLGTNRVQAYVVDDDGNVIRAGRTVFVLSSQKLDVTLSTDKPVYAPGQPAKLTFSVKDEANQPVVAALGVQIVDEAVFALIDAQPGLLKTYFGLEDAYSKPSYEIQPPPGSLPDLLFGKTQSSDPEEASAAQTKTGAQLAALGKGTIVGVDLASYAQVVADANTLLGPYFVKERERVLDAVAPAATSVLDSLAAKGCTPAVYYCDALGVTFVEAFTDGMKGSISEFDFWGNAYHDESSAYESAIKLRSLGPDERMSSADDAFLNIPYSELGVNGHGGTGGSSSGGAAGSGGGLGGTGGNGAAGTGGEGPRVRKDFPETLYVNPALITGADGKATIDVDMADSITEWRVSTLANSAGGKLGGGIAGIKVFQDFFADVNFPATLTRGDEIEFPIAVYNYLTTPESVKLVLTAGAWYTALGPTEKIVDVQPGEVVGVRFPVRVELVGLQTLTVTATGSNAADAVARSVRVVPDGKEFPLSQSGALAAGSTTHSVGFPANAVPGSEELYLQVYPAYLSQVVTGMDSMLQVPGGCFEQTTSTAWPNVLVTRYMEQTGQITPAIRLKAESLMSAGYQRLLTFEHQGGGFSWFGEQDPAPYLSVTAFGLMEFSDMAKEHPVDAAMIARTQAWLLAQQKSDGSWEGDNSEFFSFQTSVLRNTAFVIWALASNGYSGGQLAQAIAFLKTKLGTDDDAYTLGLVANAFAAAAPSDPAAAALFSTLDSKKHVDGQKVYWDSDGTQTNFYSSGNDARVTATALVAHAMLQAGVYKSSVEGALDFLASSKDPMGNFGSTQATIWTLRTLLLAAEKGTEGAVGSFQVSVDGNPFATLTLSAGAPDVMTTVDMKTLASSGAHQIGLTFIGTGKASYNLVARHNLPWSQVPAEPPGPLSVSVSYDKTTLAVNDQVLATVLVINNTPNVQNMAIVTVGIPPGFAVVTDDLDAEKASGKLASYELTGKQLTLYLSELPASVTRAFQYHLLATMPVKAADGGAKAYLYYQPDSSTSTAPSTALEVVGD